jgi:hypothetical protein
VLYGSVPVLVNPERRARALGLFYTGTIGSGAAAPVVFGGLGDLLGVNATDPKYESKLPAKGTLLRPCSALMC